MKITLEPCEGEPEVVLRGDPADPRIHAVMAALSSQDAVKAPKLLLYRDNREYLYNVEDIAYFCAEGGRVAAYAGGERFECRGKLYELTELLKTRSFLQISKSVLVNINAIQSVEAEFSGNYTAILKDVSTRLTISRLYMRAFRHCVLGGI